MSQLLALLVREKNIILSPVPAPLVSSGGGRGKKGGGEGEGRRRKEGMVREVLVIHVVEKRYLEYTWE